MALSRAVANGKVPAIMKLLESGADPNQLDSVSARLRCPAPAACRRRRKATSSKPTFGCKGPFASNTVGTATSKLFICHKSAVQGYISAANLYCAAFWVTSKHSGSWLQLRSWLRCLVWLCAYRGTIASRTVCAAPPDPPQRRFTGRLRTTASRMHYEPPKGDEGAVGRRR